jgi:hypothetical protein
MSNVGKSIDAKTIAKLVYLSIRRQGIGIIDLFVLD